MAVDTEVPASRLDRWFGSYRAALGNRDLRRLLGALLVSSTGSWAYNVALLAYVYDRTHSLGWVGAAGLVRFIPALTLSAYGGVIAERTNRIRLMVGADLVCALWQGLLALVAATGGAPWMALLLAGLTAATNIVYSPAVAATIPAVVDEDNLVAANALNGTIDNVVVVLGPALGAALLLLGSPASAFTVNAASFLLSALLVSRVRTHTPPVEFDESDGVGPLAQMAVGVRTIVGLPSARTLVAYCALVSFLYGTDTVLFISVSEQRLGLGSHGFGYLLAGLGIGGILMAAAVDRLAGSARLAPIIIAGVAGYCLPTAILAFTHSPTVAVLTQVVRGGSTLVVDVLAITCLQRSVPAENLARVFGVFFAFVLGAISLGVIVTPPLVNGVGLNATLIIMAVAPLVIAALGYPELTRIDRATAARSAELEPRVELLERLEIFSSARRSVLERVAAAAEQTPFDAGHSIVREGDAADAFYVLVDGEVVVRARGEAGGQERELRRMSAPCYFGEIGILERMPRTATVTALRQCVCLKVDGSVLLDALEGTPPSSTMMENARSMLSLTHPSRAAAAASEAAVD